MIVAFSTSSPIASVALIDPAGRLLGRQSRPTTHDASAVCLDLLDGLLTQAGRRIDEATEFLADLGPGSFTGVKVGVTLAKVFAQQFKRSCGGATSFDLVDSARVVAIHSRKQEYIVRVPGQVPERRSSESLADVEVGYGPDFAEPRYPSAEAFSGLVERLRRVSPALLVPQYVLEPNISTPKRAFGL